MNGSKSKLCCTGIRRVYSKKKKEPVKISKLEFRDSLIGQGQFKYFKYNLKTIVPVTQDLSLRLHDSIGITKISVCRYPEFSDILYGDITAHNVSRFLFEIYICSTWIYRFILRILTEILILEMIKNMLESDYSMSAKNKSD